MDPVACWNQLRREIRKGNMQDAIDEANNLCQWFQSGGFHPRGVPSVRDLDGFINTLSSVVEYKDQ
jgi:hypothetical protein